MKVTALIPDDLVAEVRHLAVGKNLTESLIFALKEWADIRKLQLLKENVRKNPLQFADGFSGQKIRSMNRS
jgi:hypothetical protein